MPISNEDKLGLLSDILNNQFQTNTLTPDEKEQVQLLTENLLADNTLHPDLAQTLTNVRETFETNSINPDWIDIIRSSSSNN